MCGIAGLLDRTGRSTNQTICAMTDLIRHRGPDSEGFLRFPDLGAAPIVEGGRDTPASIYASSLPFTPEGPMRDPNARGELFFGHRRLTILDPTPSGHQPIVDASGRYWMVYNGEVYNFAEIRRELEAEGHLFRSDGDTEVVLTAYAEWGPDCLARFNGMWAFAIYDRERRELFAARDRFGVKPFYYAMTPDRFAFASEIKAVRAAKVVDRAVNADRLYDYLAFGLTDHTAETLFAGIVHLPPGHWLRLDIAQWKTEVRRYYSLDGQRLPVRPRTLRTAVRELRALFEDAVKIRMVSDVPVGITLSGGLDSTSIACVKDAFLKRESLARCPESDKTFSVFYGNPKIDENDYIDEVVRKIHSRHFYSQVKVTDVIAEMNTMVRQLEEPFDKIGIYSQWHVFKNVQDAGVKVTLDGQGGDELFAGYHDYFPDYYRQLVDGRRLGRWTYEMGMLGARHGWGKTKGLIPRPKAFAKQLLRRPAAPLHPPVDPPFPWMSRRYWEGHRHQSPLPPPPASTGGFSGLNGRLYRSFAFESIPHSLRISDRNSMAHSVESRMPFMDYRLVEYAFALPDHLKIKQGQTKHVLRKAMRGVLPEPVRRRQDKMGFWLVLVEWLRDARFRAFLNDVAESMAKRNYLDPEGCRQSLHRLLEYGDYGGVWRWVNAELWHRQFMDDAHAV